MKAIEFRQFKAICKHQTSCRLGCCEQCGLVTPQEKCYAKNCLKWHDLRKVSTGGKNG